MGELTKVEKDRVKKGQGWLCGNPRCNPDGKRRSIKSGGQIHHNDGNHENNTFRAT